MARVILGVTGGIAAYKACELCRLLVKAGHEVTPILTADAERFVTAHTFEALARREAPRDLYPHLLDADLLVVAPLSANTLAKLAHGLADDVLTEAALAHSGPVLVAPAMNSRMWAHPATRDNVELLRARGVLNDCLRQIGGDSRFVQSDGHHSRAGVRPGHYLEVAITRLNQQPPFRAGVLDRRAQ